VLLFSIKPRYFQADTLSAKAVATALRIADKNLLLIATSTKSREEGVLILNPEIEKERVEMKIKILVLVAVLVLCGLICSLGCVAKGKQAENKEKTTASIEATQVSTQEMKTYVSKAGFSVTYPKKWYLDENSGTGWRIGSKGPAFTIANKDLSYYTSREGDDVEVFFNTFDASSVQPMGVGGYYEDNRGIYIPQNPSPNTNLEFYGKALMRTVERINIFKKRNITYCLAYGQPRGYSEKYENLFFYLPKSKSIGSIIIYGSGKYSIDGLLDIMIIQIGD